MNKSMISTNVIPDITEDFQLRLFGPEGYAQVSEIGMAITGADFETWTEIVNAANNAERKIKAVDRSVIPWMSGDAYAYGEDAFGTDEVANNFDPVNLDPKTILNRVAICRAIPVSRRRVELSFSHHAEVYKLEANQQDEMLQHAINERLSVSDLRALAKDRFPSEKAKKAKEKRELKKLAEQQGNPNEGSETEVALDEPTAVYYARQFTLYLELQQEEFEGYSDERREQYEALFASINRLARKLKNSKKDEAPSF